MKRFTFISIAMIGIILSMSTNSCTKEKEIIRETKRDSIVYRTGGMPSVENKRINALIKNTRNSWVNCGVDVTVPQTGKYLVYATTPINFLTTQDWAVGRIFNITTNKELHGFDIGTGPLDVAGSSSFIANLKKDEVLSSEIKLFHQSTASSNYAIGHESTHVALGIIKIE